MVVDPRRLIRKQTERRLNHAIVAMMGLALAYVVVDKFRLSNHVATEQPATPVAAVAAGAVRDATAIPDKSVAVHSHYEFMEGNQYISPDSVPLVISVHFSGD